MSKGNQAERELATWFWERGWASLRAPGSGSIDRPSPDVVALGSENYAVELKASSVGTVAFSGEEINELEEWAKRADAVAWVAVKPDLRSFDHWLCLGTSELHETKNGNYSIRESDFDRCLSREQAFTRP